MRFQDRGHAGRQLAERLAESAPHDPIVLALPRGGVPVAWAVAQALGAPLDVFVVRKIGASGHSELGVGAIAEDEDNPVIADVAGRLGIGRDDIERQLGPEREELQRQVAHYREQRPLPDVTEHDVVLIDDGLATGVTAEAALRALRAKQPRRLLLAAPVCAHETVTRLAQIADEVVCLDSPGDFLAVGAYYDDFAQVRDDEVLDLLHRPRATRTN